MNRQLTRNDFKKEVIDNSGLSLVHFTKEWNGACQIILPVYEELARSYRGQVNFFTVDIEKESGLENQYGVMELPTILFFHRGEVIDHITGLVPKNAIITKIETALTTASN